MSTNLNLEIKDAQIDITTHALSKFKIRFKYDSDIKKQPIYKKIETKKNQIKWRKLLIKVVRLGTFLRDSYRQSIKYKIYCFMSWKFVLRTNPKKPYHLSLVTCYIYKDKQKNRKKQ